MKPKESANRSIRESSAGTIAQKLVSILSGEWILNWTPYTANGGTVVAARAVWLSAWIFGTGFLLRTSLGEGKVADIDVRQGAADFVEILPWLGAVFAGVYAALYTRFASQWNYLAGLYNQIVEAQLNLPDYAESRLADLAAWKAGFIEDAEELHLASKPIFLVAIIQWGQDAAISEQYARNTVGGRERLNALLARLQWIRETAHADRQEAARRQLQELGDQPAYALGSDGETA